jgi:hypothetical protein
VLRLALVGDGARHAVPGPVPVRKGVAAVVVAAGALSAAGASTAHLPTLPGLGTDRVGVDLTTDGQQVGQQVGRQVAVPAPVLPPPTVLAPGIMDSRTLATAVRQAGEEGERLAARRAADDDRDGSEAERPGSALRRGTAKTPADIIDPRNWYLTLPTGKQGSPDTIDAAELASYQSEFFALNEARDGVVFTANAGGATTKNSKYPRSELREMNGDEKAAWDASSGRHTMEIVQSVDATPSAKPDVICGQIHDGEDDVMQIHLSGKRLTVKYADGKEEVVLDDDYRLGARFKVKIEATDGHIKVWYNDQPKADLDVTATKSYFKAGAYVNSNTEKGARASDVGKVTIYDLDVTHEGSK